MAEGDFDYLTTIKAMLNIIDDSKDQLLTIYIDMANQSILNYCNLNEFPSELNYVLCSIVVSFFKEMNGSDSEDDDVFSNVSSIEEDGRKVRFDYTADVAYLESALKDKITKVRELNRFKKLYRVKE